MLKVRFFLLTEAGHKSPGLSLNVVLRKQNSGCAEKAYELLQRVSHEISCSSWPLREHPPWQVSSQHQGHAERSANAESSAGANRESIVAFELPGRIGRKRRPRRAALRQTAASWKTPDATKFQTRVHKRSRYECRRPPCVCVCNFGQSGGKRTVKVCLLLCRQAASAEL